MAIDLLQSKIRKTKNLSVVFFALDSRLVPPHLLVGQDLFQAYGVFSTELMTALKGTVPALRFDMGSFAIAGSRGLELLSRLLCQAKDMGYYVLLDLPEMNPGYALDMTPYFQRDGLWKCDGLVVSSYGGSDGWKSLLSLCREEMMDIFVMVRSGNKSASEVQDLMTGGRLVHQAVAGNLNRHTGEFVGKYGYSRLAGVATAVSGPVCANLRSTYKQMFLLLDGYDYPNANAKNCSYAFDKLGHGAAACNGAGITAAWKEAPEIGHVEAALQAALRMKKNLGNYVTVL